MKQVPEPNIRRWTRYIRLLDQLAERRVATISSRNFGAMAGASGAQVRRDLAFIGELGIRGAGYPVVRVAQVLREALAIHEERRIYIIGAGKIGRALSRYAGFRDGGFKVAGVFDDAPEKIGTQYSDFVVRDVRDIGKHAAKDAPLIALIAVPAVAAQAVADEAVRAGMVGILNFAPVVLKVPDHIVVQNVDMTTELLVLAFRIRARPAQTAEE